MLPNYSRAQLLTDKYQSEGAPAGAVGYIIEVYDNGQCEVEFSRPDGTTYAQIVAAQDELQAAEVQPALAATPQ